MNGQGVLSIRVEQGHHVQNIKAVALGVVLY